MDRFLFDWKTIGTIKNVAKPLFTRVSLFDGYLTEQPSCPHYAPVSLIKESSLRGSFSAPTLNTVMTNL